MAKSPFYKVRIGTNDEAHDITDVVSNFVYEDSIEEDSLVKFNVKSDFANELADDSRFENGATVFFKFGFIQDVISEVHTSRVTDINHTYADKVSMDFVCLDLGNVVKRSNSTKIWKEKTSTQIAAEVADSWGLKVVLDETSKVWDALPQGNKSDTDFLKYLAEREEDGDYTTFIRNSTLYFVKRKIDAESAFTYTWGKDIIRFKPSWKESAAEPEAIKAKATTVNPLKKAKPTSVEANAQTQKGGAYTSTYKTVYNADGKAVGKVKVNQTNQQEKTTQKGLGKPVFDPTPDAKEATNRVNHKKKQATLKTLVAELEIEGNPLIEPNSIITVNNVAKKYAGNWYVTKVTHRVSENGYISTMDLSRNASKQKPKADDKKTESKAPSAKVNKSVGKKPEEKGSTVKLSRYDANGNKVK